MATAQDTAAAFALGSATAAPGETVDIPIEIRNNPGIIGLRVLISYDANVLTLESVQNGNLFNGGSYTFGNDLQENPYKLIWADSLSRVDYTDSGDFAVLTFRVRENAAAGETPVTITLDNGSIFDTNLDTVTFTAVSGSVTVASSSDFNWRFAEGSALHIHESIINGVQFVTGLDPDDPVVSDYVETANGYTAVVELNEQYCESTGAVLTIYDADGNVEESYEIVMFGDVDGNSLIDGIDVALIKDATNRTSNYTWITYDDTDEYAQSYAADVDHNFIADGVDVGMLRDSVGFLKTLNQSWTNEGDYLYQ